MNKPKHIALWTCPRSRSTLMTRAFDQLDKCLIFDEPFYSPYLVTHGFNHAYRQEVMDIHNPDYLSVISKITGDLPPNYSFSFQKHIAKHVLPEFGTDWLQHLHHIFLIREPKEIILSWNKAFGNTTFHNIGMADQYRLFKDVKRLLHQVPLVIDSLDLVKNPKHVLEFICSKLDLEFTENMLSWEPGLSNPQFLFTGRLSALAPIWYGEVSSSTGFRPYQPREIDSLSDELRPIEEACLPLYQELYKHRFIFN